MMYAACNYETDTHDTAKRNSFNYECPFVIETTRGRACDHDRAPAPRSRPAPLQSARRDDEQTREAFGDDRLGVRHHALD